MKDSNHHNLLPRRIIIASSLIALAVSQTSTADARTIKENPLSRDEIRFLNSFSSALDELENLGPSELKMFVEKQQAAETERSCCTTAPLALPIAAAAIWACIINTGYIFLNGTDRNRIIGQMTEVVLGCVGFPLGGRIAAYVSRFLWDHRTKIISMLSVAGLTAAKLAPLRDAPRP